MKYRVVKIDEFPCTFSIREIRAENPRRGMGEEIFLYQSAQDAREWIKANTRFGWIVKSVKVLTVGVWN
jgi:hypothetical protein